jgi:hypothetical protein
VLVDVAAFVVAVLPVVLAEDMLVVDSSARGVVGVVDGGATAGGVSRPGAEGLADATIDWLTGAAGFDVDVARGGNDTTWLDVKGDMGKASGATTPTPTDAVANAMVITVSFDGRARLPNHPANSRPRMKSPPTPLIRVRTPDREL